MIAHLVLFKPRPDLSDDERLGLIAAFETAVREIQAIRRVRIGQRVTHGREYESLMRVDYQFVALLEFDTLADLKAYLEHPAHQELGMRFFGSLQETLIYDYDLADGAQGIPGEHFSSFQ